MKGFLFFTIIGILYYLFQSRYPQPIIHHIYISVFIFLGYILIYLMRYHQNFMYKVVKNVNDVNKAPVYSLIPDFKIDENNNISY